MHSLLRQFSQIGKSKRSIGPRTTKRTALSVMAEADKKFNPDLPENQMVDAILNGLPAETPPDMPAFADKGINEERAKALIAYMKSLR